jgi:peroxiredoxin
VGAENVAPLKVGAHAPAVVVKTVDGANFDLGQAVSAKPTILMFYRGGWCPYCNRQLAGIQEYEQRFLALGYQILAVCTDKPENLRATMDKHGLSYTLLSDRAMAAAGAFQVAYRVPDDVAKKTASYHIDLPEIPGEPGGRWLPVPAIFIIGKDGVIKFAEFNSDYKVRPPPEEILAAASRVQ